MMQLDPSSSSISVPINPIPSEQPSQVEVNITYMDRDMLKGAQDGDMELFNKYQGGLHCLVDGRQNTALHIYSRTGGRRVVKNDKQFVCLKKRRSEREFSINFVEQLVDKCPSLLLQPNDRGEIPLHIAAERGYSDIVKFLIDRVKVVQQSDLERGVLEAPCRLKQMLSMRDKDGNTALYKAVESGDLDVVQLLMKDLDPDFSFSANTSGETPLYLAAKAGRNHLVAEILDNWKSTDYGGPHGRTPLHVAVMVGDEKLLRKPIEANNHLTQETDASGLTPLHYAAFYGETSNAKVLLESDVSVAYITEKERGMTALHMAAWRGRKDTMEIIISCCPGCCEIVDKRGWNFLHLAVFTLDPIKLKRFLMGDKNQIEDLPIRNLVNEKDVNGNRPYDFMVYRLYRYNSRSSRQVVEFLSNYLKYTYIYSNCETKKNQIHKSFEDLANDAEVIGLPIDLFCEIKKRKDQEKEKKDKIREKAQKYHLVVATLVATGSFTAGFTIPGGYKSDERGTATSNYDSLFKIFILTNTLAFLSALSAISLHFLYVMVDSEDDEYSLPRLIRRVDLLILIAVGLMVVSFASGTSAVFQFRPWLACTIFNLGLLFFPIIRCLASI